jgi:transposase
MKLSDCIFSEKDIKQLRDYRDRQKDTELKLRFIAILSVVYDTEGIEAGIRHTAEIFGKDTETIKNRLRLCLTGGAEKLNFFNYKPKQSYLNRHQINQVIISVTYENPATAKEVHNYIKEKFSITYCAEAVRKLLIKNRLKVIRPRTVPGNPPSPEDQKKLLINIIR